jgi:adenosylcobinamide-GDP ribazoletransferase
MIALVCVIVTLKFQGLFIFVIIALSAYIIGKFINNRIGGITGDTLGAINELIEVMVLFSICILERINLCII